MPFGKSGSTLAFGGVYVPDTRLAIKTLARINVRMMIVSNLFIFYYSFEANFADTCTQLRISDSSRDGRE